MRKRTGIGLAALAAGILAALWLALSPGWTVSAMADAAAKRDNARLAAYVDAEQVRNGLIEVIAAQMALAEAKGGKLNPAIAAGSMNAARRMVSGMDVIPLVASAFTGNEPDVDRTGITRFTARRGDGGLEYELRGVTWKVVGIRTPDRS